MARCLALAALVLTLAACRTTRPAGPSPDAAAAQAVVLAYVGAFDAGDFRAAAELMDPVELEQFVGLIGPLMEMQGAPDDAGTPPDDAPGAFAWLMETLGGAVPGLAEGLASAEADLIGSVAEGDSLIHVVMRTRASVMGLDAEQVSITTTRRRGDRWAVALSGDLNTFAQAMRRFGDRDMGEDPFEEDEDPGMDGDGDKQPLKPGRDG